MERLIYAENNFTTYVLVEDMDTDVVKKWDWDISEDEVKAYKKRFEDGESFDDMPSDDSEEKILFNNDDFVHTEVLAVREV